MFCRTFFHWYNNDHRHQGVALLTPETVHYGRAGSVIAARQEVLHGAYAAHPERFVRKLPVAHPLAEAVWINPACQRRNRALNHYTNFLERVSQNLVGAFRQANREFLMNLGAGTSFYIPYTFSSPELDIAIISLDQRDSRFADQLYRIGLRTHQVRNHTRPTHRGGK